MAPDALNPLRPAQIIRRMAEALPTHDKDDTTSDLSSSLDVVALCIHASMVNLDFKLISLNEDDTTCADCARLAPRLPSAWNASINSRNFVYSHTQSSMKFIIRVDRLGRKAEIRGLATGDDRIARFEITPDDYISKPKLPLRIPFATQDDGTTAEDRGEALDSRLTSLFTTHASISDLAKSFKTNIIQKLAPSIFKEGYEEENPDDRAARQDAEASARSGARQPHHPPRPDFPEPARPGAYPQPPGGFPVPAGVPTPAGDFPPPGFEDEYEVNRPPRGAPFNPNPLMGGIHNPYGIGGSDLYPAGLGPGDPLRSSFVPGRIPDQGGAGGMHPTFDDPVFQGPRGQGDPNFDPQAPPGARWDPIGPGGAPRFGGGRPGGRGGGGFSGGFGGSGFGDII